MSSRTTSFETMTWDEESRMLSNSLANASYAYNGFDARVSKTVGANTTTFKRAGADPVSPVLSDVVGATTTRYLPGISSNVGGTSTFNHSGIKNGILQTNSSQSNTATKRYDAFGNDLATTGTWQTRFDYGGAFGYQKDSESDYKLLGHRYYDPKIGRFLTRDPVEDGRNWYSYCNSGPLSYLDPAGRKRHLAQRIWDWFIQMPQNALGVIGSVGGKIYPDPVTGAMIVENAWLPKVTGYNITLGEFILSGEKLRIADLEHERQHVDQSRSLGGFYLIAHATGYVIGAAASVKSGSGLSRAFIHDASPLEVLADVNSHSQGNEYLKWRFAEVNHR